MRLPTVLVAATVASAAAAAPQSVQIRSGPAGVALLELYTSEGCSSCPPGEKWFSALTDSPDLWRDLVPVAFHVDYWDHLGWPDPLASHRNTERQRRYAAEWHANSIYTPGFVLAGREWRIGRRSVADIKPGPDAGTLSATGKIPGKLAVEFDSVATGPWVANAAILGSGIEMDVLRGENKGRHLLHDFAVLEWHTTQTDANGRASFDFAALPTDHGAKRLAVVVWIERAESPVPLQAAGGWMEKTVEN